MKLPAHEVKLKLIETLLFQFYFNVRTF